MIKYLTSDFKNYEKVNGEKITKPIDNTNGFVDSLKSNLKKTEKIVFVVSDGHQEHEKNMVYANIFFDSLKMVGIHFNEYCVLEDVTRDKASEYIAGADIVFLCGGRTSYQMKFFDEINLKELLENYNGIVIGQSAGAINMADVVYNSPEDLEQSDPIIYPGLGLTNINIEPHFQYDTTDFDETEQYQRNNILEESMKRCIIGQCNGSHVMVDEDNNVIICGQTYMIDNGNIELICRDGEKRNFNSIKRTL